MKQNVFAFLAVVILFTIVSGFVSAAETNQSAKDLPGIAIVSISPDTGKAGTIVAFNITGTGFVRGTQVYLEKVVDKRTKIVNGESETVSDPSTISGRFDIKPNTATGNWTVNIKHDSQITSSKVNFTVTN
jgi:hypothetical protein